MIVITGASDGVGKQVAKLYKEAGKTVVNISRRECEYADINICLSLREGDQIKEASDKILEIDEPIEVIVNAVGVWGEEPFGKITEVEIKRLMSTNVKAPMLLVSNLFERIKKDETDILNIISTAGVRGRAEFPLYSASKWAERGYTKSLQEALNGTKSRVISFCPGGINTDFFEKAGNKDLNTSEWMHPTDIARFIKQILDLPKNIEVSEIILNRKSIS
ncbi:MAG: short-subunit dehydrogenase [Flavobacteriaceae bacterium]|jgi:short-subunit dehydrogenase